MPPIRDVSEACRQLEAMIVRQLVATSGAFRGGAAAGSQIQTDMFVEAMADAVVRGGGLGLAKQLERSFGDAGGAAATGDGAPSEAPPGAGASGRMPGAVRGALSYPGSYPAPLPGGATVTSAFGPRRDPIHGDAGFHTGVDLRGAEGTAIRAAAAGVVKSAGPRGGYGNAVEIDHGGGVSTLYAHASALAVKPGDRIARGQEVAAVGQTGRATGPHLHFEVRVSGRPIDPTRALNAYGIRADVTVGTEPPSRALK